MPMSINGKNKTVAEILNRAATDAAFRNLLYTDPGSALAGYDLPADQRQALSDPEAVKAALNG
ncbi:MAG: hypothetical protein J5I90_02490 [Caldilineales bacterium]|nr:hypothetical protein [Caldilineales bacterium]